jgi:hypothetical protein
MTRSRSHDFLEQATHASTRVSGPRYNNPRYNNPSVSPPNRHA